MNDGPCLQLLDLWTSDPDETTLQEVLIRTARLIPELIFPGGSFCCKGRVVLYGEAGACSKNETEYWSQGPVPRQHDSRISAFIPSRTMKRWGERSDSKEPQLPAAGKLELFYHLEKEAMPPSEHMERLQGLAKRLGRVLTQRWKLKDLKGELANTKLSARRLRESLQLAKLGQWDLDLTNNHLTWSDEIYRLFQIDPRKFGASYEAFLNAIHPDDREFVDKAYTDSLITKKPYNIVHRLLFADGSVKWVNEVCRTEFHPRTGKPLYSIGTVQDITATKEGRDAVVPGTVHILEQPKKRDVCPKRIPRVRDSSPPPRTESTFASSSAGIGHNKIDIVFSVGNNDTLNFEGSLNQMPPHQPISPSKTTAASSLSTLSDHIHQIALTKLPQRVCPSNASC